MAFWAYILRCADGSFYTGHTDNLDARIGQHLTGGYCDYTPRRLPIELAWAQDFSSRIEALEAERRVKKWSRAKKEALIAGDWNMVSYYARPPRERVSTSLDTNGFSVNPTTETPFASSEVGKHSPIP
jgi:predicted GIY-YIG superfamily endonuclease